MPQNLIRAIVDSNATRKQFIADQILTLKPRVVGVYRLVMKSGSDNFRQSAMLDIIEILKERDIPVIIYEPTLSGGEALGCPLSASLDELAERCDVILANRWNDELAPWQEKVYTRDLWQRD